MLYLKVYLSPIFFFFICERDTFQKSIAPTFKEKGSSGNEIMLHKVLKIPGSEKTLEKTTNHRENFHFNLCLFIVMTTSAKSRINHSRITAPGQNRENNGVYSILIVSLSDSKL